MVTCCVSVCETHSGTVVKAVNADGENSVVLPLLRLLLEAQGAPGYYPLHETRSNLLFSLWYILQVYYVTSLVVFGLVHRFARTINCKHN